MTTGSIRCSPPEPEARPLWQRITLPLVGLLCILLATIAGFLPFLPGWPLALIGAPLLAAFNPRWEAWIRHHRHRLARIVARWCRRRTHTARRRWRRWRRGIR